MSNFVCGPCANGSHHAISIGTAQCPCACHKVVNNTPPDQATQNIPEQVTRLANWIRSDLQPEYIEQEILALMYRDFMDLIGKDEALPRNFNTTANFPVSGLETQGKNRIKAALRQAAEQRYKQEGSDHE